MLLSDFYSKPIPPALLASPAGRRALCANDPLLFAAVYLPEHVRMQSGPFEGQITLSEFHLQLVREAQSWRTPADEPKAHRDVYIAPRGSGKSTWLFLVMPLWAAAYGYVSFAVAFSVRADQAQRHLETFKHELAFNERLRADFPDLCAPKLDVNGRVLAWNAAKVHMRNDFVFYATGIDFTNLGIKEGNRRPDLLLLDDIEPGEKNYSVKEVLKTRNTVFDDIAPMNLNARLVLVGTTTMAGSVIDQCRQYAEGMRSPELQWLQDERVNVHYYPAVLQNDDGTERSLWPEQWPLDWLQQERGKRSFEKNFMNKPLATDSELWQPEDVLYGKSLVDGVETYGNTLLSIDPAVSSNKLSDYTGIAVLSRGADNRVYVRHAAQLKLSPQDLRAHVQQLVELFEPGLLYCEVNQGGDLWQDVFSGLPVKYRAMRQKPGNSKVVRAGKAFNFYQQGRVVHTERFPVLEAQLYAFPRGAHDDVLDAVVSGVLYFLDKPRSTVAVKQLSYAY